MYLTERGERRVCRRSLRTAVAQLPTFRALLSHPGSVKKVIETLYRKNLVIKLIIDVYKNKNVYIVPKQLGLRF